MVPSNIGPDMRATSPTFKVLPTQDTAPSKDQDKGLKAQELKHKQLQDENHPALSGASSLPETDQIMAAHGPAQGAMEGAVSISATSQNPQPTNGATVARETRDSTPVHQTMNGHGNTEGAQPSARATTPKHVTIAEDVSDGKARQRSKEPPSTPSPSTSVSGNRILSDDSSHDEAHEEEEAQDIDVEMERNSYQHPSDEKYKRLKRKLKEVLEENERMSQELDKSHRRVRNLRREKNLLLDRLCTLERRDSDSDLDSLSPLSSDSESSDSSVVDEVQYKKTPQPRKNGRGAGGAQSTAASPGGSAGVTAYHPKKNAAKNNRRPSPAATSGAARSGIKDTKIQVPVSTPSTITNVGSATQKPKRVHQTNKQRPGLAKVRKVQALEKDEAGNVKLPVTVGIITILDIGHVVYDREAFHNDRYIFPVGYKMSRSYNSMIDPHNLTVYTCSVIDDGEAPKFQIDAADQPGKPIIAGTATGAWTHVVKAANAIRRRDHSNSASGPDYFGFSNATIAKMIQDLPNADKCETYIMQRFEEPSATGTSNKGSSDKRKASALSSAKAGEIDGVEGEDQDEEAEEDDDEYTTLGTPGKKPKTTSSPRIRHAGIDGLPFITFGRPLETAMEPDEAEHDRQVPVVITSVEDVEAVNVDDPESEVEVDVGMDDDDTSVTLNL
ncbi:hypothetical protein BGZ70_007784 [Mortierella alpina]|uniref:INO80 complex subunit E N-terminal domain-containing protein n=1 Tax=Mortierella alpina TaxID=64518 RepID=A0A9P6M2B0_MORAP|nr:hypothetical protein BGZ70_007784 [Mortierella alpina]